MKFELWISARYFITQQKERFVSAISVIAVLGIAIGVTALIGTLGVMTGFGNQLREKMIGANPHLMIRGDLPIFEYEALEEKIRTVEGVKETTRSIQGQAFFYQDNRVSFLFVRGIEPQTQARVTQLKEYIKHGTFFIKDGEVVIGSELAVQRKLALGDVLSLGSPVTNEIFDFTVAGIFDSGYYEYDARMVLLPIVDAQALFGLQESITEIGVKVDNPQRVTEIKKDVISLIGPQYYVNTWMDLNKNLLSALKLEKIVMFLVVTLIVLVASFNIACTLIVAVTQKTKDIGILRSIGATGWSIAKIFAFGGLSLGVVGILLGIAGGLLVCHGIKHIHHVIDIPQEIYYFDRVPVAFNLHDLIWISGCAIIICFVSTLYPAWKAARLNPVEALRYE